MTNNIVLLLTKNLHNPNKISTVHKGPSKNLFFYLQDYFGLILIKIIFLALFAFNLLHNINYLRVYYEKE